MLPLFSCPVTFSWLIYFTYLNVWFDLVTETHYFRAIIRLRLNSFTLVKDSVFCGPSQSGMFGVTRAVMDERGDRRRASGGDGPTPAPPPHPALLHHRSAGAHQERAG